MSDESSSDYRGEERRESERTQGAFVVRMRFPRLEDYRYRYTRDLSRGGVFIQTLNPKPAGAKVVLVLEPRGGRAVSISGEVVTSLGPEEAAARQLQPGMGIRFLDLDADKRRAIETTLENWDVGATEQQPAPPAAPPPVVGPIDTRGSTDDLARVEADAKAYLARIETSNFYTLLDVSPEASSGELRTSFLALTKRFHPDRYFRRAPAQICQDLEDIYNQLTKAYETLVDRDRRTSYDLAIGNLGGNKDGVAAVEMARLAGEDRRRKNAPGRVSKAEQLVAQANQEIAAGQKSKALANLRLALAFDPDNTQIQAKIADLKAKR